MKKIKSEYLKFTKALFIAFFIIQGLAAQAPKKMSYQAVVRNSDNSLVISTNIGVKISVLQGTLTGNTVYIETQNVTTNSNGLVSLKIGEGTIESGSFDLINWGNGPYYIKSEIDVSGGVNYAITSTSELMSVPYALFAANGGLKGDTGFTRYSRSKRRYW